MLVTSGGKCFDKFKVMLDFCDECGMILNSNKTKFMVINGANNDKLPLEIML